MPSAQRTGISSVMPMVEVALRLSGIIVGASRDAAAGQFRDEMTPDQKPKRQSGVDPAGHQQHGPLAGKAEGRRFAGRNRNAVGLDAAEPRQCPHALVIAAAAGAADARSLRRLRRAPALHAGPSVRHAMAAPDLPTKRASIASPASISGVVAARPRAIQMRGSRTFNSAKPTAAATAQSMSRMRSPARRKTVCAAASPPAGKTPWPVSDGRDHLDALAALRDGIERRHRIGSARQRLAGFDPLRQRRQGAPAHTGPHRRPPPHPPQIRRRARSNSWDAPPSRCRRRA